MQRMGISSAPMEEDEPVISTPTIRKFEKVPQPLPSGNMVDDILNGRHDLDEDALLD